MFVFFTFSLLCLRLYGISTETDIAETLDAQYSRHLPVSERRGFILDITGAPLNAESHGYITLVDPTKCNNIREYAEALSKISQIPQSQMVDRLAKGPPFTLITEKEATGHGIYSYRHYTPGVTCASHLVGYTSPDGEGKSGIEKAYDGYLTNVCNARLYYRYSANAGGIPLKSSGTTFVDKGYSEISGVVTTLDKSLQTALENIAGQYIKKGALCVSKIDSGSLVASLSLPDFDTNNVASYLESKNGELINRCAESFTPGSVFKTVVAAAALEYDKDLYNLEYTCVGKYEKKDSFTLSCHNKEGHGALTMKEAYAGSCNPYFVNLAEKIGIERVLSMAEKMGLGKVRSLDGITYYGQALPQDNGIDKGFFANIAIGQGKLLVSPYEMLGVYSCAATGNFRELSALSALVRGENTIRTFEKSKTQVLSDTTCQKLREMMALCIEEGLGKDAAPKNLTAGGKTATAQTGQKKDGRELLNTWFCGVYPIDNPQYTICVLLDGEGAGKDARSLFRETCNLIYSLEYISE